MPMRFVAYGRNQIPETPPSKSHPGTSVATTNQARKSQNVFSPNLNRKRNNIAPTRSSSPRILRGDQVTRNHVNGITLPDKFMINEHAPIHPIKPRFHLNTNSGQKLSSFLKKVKSLQDTFKGDNMKQDLIFYNDDVTNKTRHRPTNFAPPTRKLGSQGAPGGSKVTFVNENGKQWSPGSRTTTEKQPANEHIKILTRGGKTLDLPQRQGKVDNVVSSAIQPKESTNREEKQSQGIEHQNETIAAKPLAQGIVGSTKASNFDNPKVDLRLLKEKVLHSNNSRFLRRVLLVLRKYTKLMKSSMVDKKKNQTTEPRNVGKTISNVSTLMKVQDQMLNVKKVNNSQKVGQNSKDFHFDKADEDNESSTEDFKSKNKTHIAENGVGLKNAVNLASAAVRIFDSLNNGSKYDSENSIKKVNSQIISFAEKNSTSDKPGSKKSDWGSSDSGIVTFQDSEPGNSHSESQKPTTKSLADIREENPTKKENIETKHSLGRPVFNVENLKYSFDRGNTID